MSISTTQLQNQDTQSQSAESGTRSPRKSFSLVIPWSEFDPPSGGWGTVFGTPVSRRKKAASATIEPQIAPVGSPENT
jgi:hypothetical protein